ncbi:gamma-glutamyl-gamma-aminobutyrate hydrolase family protein [Sedimentibacter sp.]|uniref:gamma-glutamyl-gamma-aminobutyrate hydrolase family protein n=1 Tax=Sedimentibacter sp. TaxID=1960295 RepID=UPI0028AD6D46|nr:gamma-glutamyl-gamma-aminobutyrate hydrolase family protein [Sedimentibacter sp.]
MKALITQREQLDSHGVPIDVLESTYVKYFEQLGVDLFQLSNFTKNLDRILDANTFDLIILTGGGSIHSKFYREEHNDLSQLNRDRLEWALMECSLKNSIPILAICRGMEYMNAFLGGKITKFKALKESRLIGKEHDIILGDGTKISVNNYHNDGIFKNDIAKEFEIIGLDVENNVVEAMFSLKMKWLGIQWHPERLMNDEFSKDKCNNLIQEFIRSGGIINESYYFSGRTRDET